MKLIEIWQIIGQISAIVAIFLGVILAWVLQRYGKKQDEQDVKISALERAHSENKNQLAELIARFDERTASFQRFLNAYVNILKQTEKKVEDQTGRLNEIKGQLDTLFLLKNVDRRTGAERRKVKKLQDEG